MSTLALVLAATALALITLRAAAHLAIRLSLAAPRVRETGTPAALGLAFETARIPTANGKHLHAWLIPAPASAPAPAVIVLHGWGGNAEMMLPLARPLHEAGFAALFLDARCHGLSDADSFASLPRFAEDASRACDWLAARPEIDRARIALLGHSVGAGAVLFAAANRGDIAAVVSVSAFAHPAEMMRRWLAGKGLGAPLAGCGVDVPLPSPACGRGAGGEGPAAHEAPNAAALSPALSRGEREQTPPAALRVRLARRLGEFLARYVLAHVERTIGHRFDDIAPLRSVARLRCPVLLVHGAHDPVVPPSDAHRLHGAAAAGSKLLMLSADHESFDGLERELQSVIAFLRAVTPPRSASPAAAA